MRAGDDFHDTIRAGVLLMLAAAVGMTPPVLTAMRRRCLRRKRPRRLPSVNDVDIMKDIDVSKLDWSLLNVDASTLTGPAPKASGASKAAGSADTVVVRQ